MAEGGAVEVDAEDHVGSEIVSTQNVLAEGCEDNDM